MDAALQQQLGELLLNAVPTIVLFLALYVAYRQILHNPLMKVLAERHAKTAGAVAKAQADIAAAEARTAEYEQRMREARAGVFKSMEAQRKQLMEARAAGIAEAKANAQTQVKAAKAEIEKEAAVARAGLQGQVEALAQEVINAVINTSGKSGSAPAAGRS
ncbi:MAG TPA: ATP synthase F0 subunit B [Terriglobales bacterium]|nr:ATP synthase F0 subunit B [Terriglobales bacterium]